VQKQNKNKTKRTETNRKKGIQIENKSAKVVKWPTTAGTDCL